jgi:putative glycosyltransferase (TIGR04372 family)
MKKLFKGILGITSYCIFRIVFRSRELLVIETNIFGHAILESALLSRYMEENPKRKVFYVLHSHSANTFLTESIIRTLTELNLRQNILAPHAINGQDILVNRMKIDRKLKTVQFQEELTHLTASNLKDEYLPKFKFRSELNSHKYEANKSIIFMNRSAAYKKFQESSNLHAYRDFDFSTLDSLDIKPSDSMQFIRIGVPDGVATSNPKIIDRRQEIAGDPELDIKVQLSATGYFGADSGPAWFALALSKPVAFINMIPLNQVSPSQAEKLVVIPKLIYSKRLERLLTLSEMLSPEVSLLRNSIEYNAVDLQPISNTSEDASNFFSDWLSMLTNSSDIVNENYMREIRSKFNLPNLPSIHSRFVENHPEVFSIE